MSFYEGKKVLVAGGGGLIGQALIRALVPLGAKVRATYYANRRIDGEWKDKIVAEWHDLAKRPLPYKSKDSIYNGQDIVFWAAAKVGGAKAIKENPMELVHYNLELAARNINAAVINGVDRFCYVSSSYVYPELDRLGDGYDRPNIELDTETWDVPMQHYGLGWVKRFMEKLCKSHQLTGRTRFALVRPTAIYGPHDNFDLETCHVVPALIRKVAEGQNPLEVWGNGKELRQFTYVDDLVQGLLLATEHYALASPINIATPEVSSVEDVWRTLLKVAGKKYVGDHTWNIQDPWESFQRVKYMDDKPQVVSKRVVNTDLCRMALGYVCKTSLEDGLRKTYEWYKQRA